MATKNKILRKIIASVMLVTCIAATGCSSNNTSEEPSKPSKREYHNYPVYDAVEFSLDLWQKQEYKFCPEYDRTETDCNVKGVFLRHDYKGEESYAFGYLGYPENFSEKKTYPAVLLVHGGGGTAYYQWVKEWNDRGYVAFAIDTEGHIPKESGTVENAPADLYTKSEYPAPHNQNYADADNNDIEDTWMYYAVSLAVRANSFLRRLSYVDSDKVGICGISWGGIITSITTGYDDRFAFSIPIYCTLNNYGSTGNIPSYYNNHRNAIVWDDDTGMARVNTPILFLAGINDINQTPQTVSKTASHCKNARISLVKGFLHSHAHALGREEPFAFADEIIFGKKTMATFENQDLTSANGNLKVIAPKGATVNGATLVYNDTADSGWNVKSLAADNGKITLTETVAAGGYYYVFVEVNGTVTSTLIAQA